MFTRAGCAAIVALLTLQGCTSVVHYAVVAPAAAVSEEGGCFRQCQLYHAAETKKYLACLRNCRGVRIFEGKQCGEAEYDASRYECSNAHAQKFDPTLGIVLIAIGVLAMVVIVASSPSPQPQMP